MKALKDYFKDKHGHIVVWQSPNPPLWAWIVTQALALILNDSTFKDGLGRLGTASLFVWAYLELTSGLSPFRRTMGGLALTLITIKFFS